MIRTLYRLIAFALISVLVGTYAFGRGLFYDTYEKLQVTLATWTGSERVFENERGFFCGTADSASSDIFSRSRTSSGRDIFPSTCGSDQTANAVDGYFRTCAGFPNSSLGSAETIWLPTEHCLTYQSRYRLSCEENPVRKENASHVADSALSEGSVPSPPEFTSATSHNSLDQHQNGTRTAIVLRTWDGFQWTADDIRNVRAMVTEMEAVTHGYFSVHILVHLKSGPGSVQHSAMISESEKLDLVPADFVSLAEFWTYADCAAAYPDVGEYDVYNHTFMSLQLFVHRHPDYDFFWNWEMDARYTGHYHDLFLLLAAWADEQPLEGLWARNTRFYIPSHHHSFHGLSEASMSGITDPRPWSGVAEVNSSDISADLITLFPMFDTTNTHWPHKDNLVHFEPQEAQPRFGTVGTNIRLSRRLLNRMDAENTQGRTMMSEMWPPTLAYHHGYKAVYVPHPIYMEKRWSASALQLVFNGGQGGRMGGSWMSVINHERDFEGATWFWNSQWPRTLYEQWMGSEAHWEGSREWVRSHGPMCLPPMLLHPVKASKFANDTI